MTWGEFEWVRKMKEPPDYAEITNELHSETRFGPEGIRERGVQITEARVE